MAENKTEVSNVKPPVATGTSAATDESQTANTQVNPADTAAEVRENESKEAETKVEERKQGAKEANVKQSNAPEEKAAERAGVPKERLDGGEHAAVQNRAPRNQFEKENQKVTEQERKAAQKVSDMSTDKRVENAETPAEVAQKDAAKTAEVNQGSEIAAAIAAGLKDAKGGNFKLQADEGVQPRFSLVKNKSTGEVLLRENETGHLSQLQLKSLEEKESSLQDQEVEEL